MKILYDPETDMPYEVSDEVFAEYSKLAETVFPKVDGVKGRVIITSIPVDEENYFKKLWNGNQEKAS
jgi:hypothetical protein